MTNARKSREKHRMEKEELRNEEFEQERRMIMSENFQVYECSGTQDHDPDCNGECEVLTLSDGDIALNKEKMRWAELGIPNQGSIPDTAIPGIPIDTFHMRSTVKAVIDLLVEKGIATQDEIDAKFIEVHLDIMTTIRERNEGKILEMRRRQEIALPGGPDGVPIIDIPDHIRRKMN